MVLVKVIKIKIPEFVVADVMGKHVIDGDQDFVDHCHRCSFVSTPSFETESNRGRGTKFP